MEWNRAFVGMMLTASALVALSRTFAGEPSQSPLSSSATVAAPGDQTVFRLCSAETPAGCQCGPACEKECAGNECGTCCNLCPCVYAEVDGLLMWRNRGFANQPIVIDNATSQTVLSTSDLSTGAAGGMRALIGFQVCGMPVEFNYFGLFDQFASASVASATPNAFTLPDGLGRASDVFVGANRIDVRYDSKIHNAEINFPCCNCCCNCSCDGDTRCRSWEWMVGFRYLSLRETLDVFGTRIVSGAPETGDYNIQTHNDLYGAQFGARFRRCLGRLSWEATGKAGIYGNDAGQAQFVQDYPNFALRPAIGAGEGRVAFLGELNLTAIYQLNDTWGLRAGYNLIFIDGLALAPDQLDFTFTSTSGSVVNSGRNLVLQGVNVGLEARW